MCVALPIFEPKYALAISTTSQHLAGMTDQRHFPLQPPGLLILSTDDAKELWKRPTDQLPTSQQAALCWDNVYKYALWGLVVDGSSSIAYFRPHSYLAASSRPWSMWTTLCKGARVDWWRRISLCISDWNPLQKIQGWNTFPVRWGLNF